jgi:hypothetical protein
MEPPIMHRSSIVLLGLTLLAAAPAIAQQRMYKCVDAKGKVYYTQIPPPQCLGRDTEVLNKSGTVIRTNKAPIPLTAEQKRAQEAARRKKLEDEEQAKEERRKNLALLNTYPSEKDIDDARARALAEAQSAIHETEKRIIGAQNRKKDLEKEKEFYVKKPLPVKLRQSIADNDIEIKNQTGLLEAKKKEISAINAKYDEDKRRYIELTSGKSDNPAKK